MDLERFRRLPLMGIVRGATPDQVAPLVEAVVAAGLETLEIAMNTPDAAAVLARTVEVAGDRLVVGAGTVVDPARLDAALAAGATFVVLPTLVDDVVRRCRTRGIPVFPGALTPHEIHTAWRAGATMVKVFPANVFGPEYLREVKGPFDEIELLACGGVSPANLAAFFACGASAVAFGGSVFTAERLGARDLAPVGAAVRALIAAYRAAAA